MRTVGAARAAVAEREADVLISVLGFGLHLWRSIGVSGFRDVVCFSAGDAWR